MRAMKPFFDTIWDFAGFEFVAFWLGIFIGAMAAGFFLDMLMRRQGFGVVLNGVYALLGIFIGLYLRYNYFMITPWPGFEPYLTAGLCLGSTVVLLLVFAFVRNRFWP